jgi:hypothetical protein
MMPVIVPCSVLPQLCQNALMKLPFTLQQFLDVFTRYNQFVWPMQVVLVLFALSAVLLSFKKIAAADKLITLLLSFFWLWMGIVYHIVFFSEINKAAYLFGGLFILEGILWLYSGLVKNSFRFRFRPGLAGYTGLGLVLVALLLYPAIGYLLGHVYPASPTFGLPCPTTIFTWGILLWSGKKVPLLLIIIPLLWSFIGFMAALQLGIREDVLLLLAGIVAGTILLKKRNVRMH